MRRDAQPRARTRRNRGRPRAPRLGPRDEPEGARSITAVAVLRMAVLALASGAVAVGAGAVGALAVNRLAVNRAALREVRIGTLDIERLRVHQREEPASDG